MSTSPEIQKINNEIIDKLMNLEIGEFIAFGKNSNLFLVRVPNGWVYRDFSMGGGTCFVPERLGSLLASAE